MKTFVLSLSAFVLFLNVSKLVISKGKYLNEEEKGALRFTLRSIEDQLESIIAPPSLYEEKFQALALDHRVTTPIPYSEIYFGMVVPGSSINYSNSAPGAYLYSLGVKF